MNKKQIQALIVIIVIYVAVLSGYLNYYQHSNEKQLPGQLIICNGVEGMKLLNFPIGDKQILLPDYYIVDLAYSKDRGKAVIYVQEFSNARAGIYEYNFITKQLELIRDAEEIPDYQPGYLEYLPDKNAFSYIRSNTLYIYDLDTKEETRIIDDIGSQYNWNNDGNSLLYSTVPAGESDYYICKYNIITKQTEELAKGYNPVYSQDNKYIAYKTNDNLLVVKNFSNGEYWNYYDKGYYNYVFSPDGQYLAITRVSNTSLDLLDASIFDVYIWQFMTDKPEKILTLQAGAQSFIWDYIALDE